MKREHTIAFPANVESANKKGKQITLTDFIDITDLPIPSPSHKPTVHFENRKEAVDAIKLAIHHNRSVYEQTSKGKFTVLCALNGSGTGKTRVADEALTIAREQGGIFKNTQEVYINLYIANEKESADPTNPQQFLGIRVFSKALRKQNVSRFYADTLYYDFTDTNIFEPSLVIQAIGKKYKELLGVDQNTLLPLVLILDEIQSLYEDIGNWEDIATGIRTMVENQHQVLVIPIVTGLLSTSQLTEIPRCKNVFLPLPPLEPEHVANLLAAENLSHTLENHKLLHFWNQMAVVPRNLRNAIDVAHELSPKYPASSVEFADKLIENSTELICCMYVYQRRSHRYTTDARKLLLYAFSATKAPTIDDKWFRTAMNYGFIQITANNRLYLPYVIFEELIEYYNNLYHSLLPRYETIVTHDNRILLDLMMLTTRIEYQI
jgi:hypothetical protein